jgi:hypothetical protein
LVRRSVGRFGGVVGLGVVSLTSIASSAFSNAMVTYAVGKRAQAVAQLRDAPITALPAALRAFSGVDERRVLVWTVEATRSSLERIGSVLRRLTWRSAESKKTPAKRREYSRP